MDPISIVTTALINGASKALKDTANQAVKDAYLGLKVLISNQWSNSGSGDKASSSQNSEAEILIKNLEDNPEVFQIPIEQKLPSVIPNPDQQLIEHAQQLIELLNDAEPESSHLKVEITDSKGVQVGNHNKQLNNF